MGRTASPATPGTNPVSDSTDDLAQAVVSEGLRAETAEAKAERLEREMVELRALVHQLGRNQVAQALPERVELPSLASVMKQKPPIAVLTAEGWYVPEVHPTDRAGKN